MSASRITAWLTFPGRRLITVALMLAPPVLVVLRFGDFRHADGAEHFQYYSDGKLKARSTPEGSCGGVGNSLDLMRLTDAGIALPISQNAASLMIKAGGEFPRFSGLLFRRSRSLRP